MDIDAFFMEFTELWLTGVAEIVAQVSTAFFTGSIGSVMIGILVFNLFCIYIIRPATHASSDSVLTKAIGRSRRDAGIDADKALGEWHMNRMHQIDESMYSDRGI